MSENVTNGEILFRKAGLQTIADCVDIADDVIRFTGDKADLGATTANGATCTASGVRNSTPEMARQSEQNCEHISH